MTAIPETNLPRSTARRLLGGVFGQARRTQRCPDAPRLDDALAVVTGATSGIGVEIARGLARRGAALILPCRNTEKAARVVAEIRSEVGPDARIDPVGMDLEDLESVRDAAKSIEIAAAGRRVGVLVENAGVWPRRHTLTRQGHEIAFGVNVLAHFVLRQELQRRGLLSDDGRVVVVTGDIYITESACTPDFGWRGTRGGMRAYCRSKLGNLWIAAELHRRFPQLSVYSAHPGVVATNLGGGGGALGERLRAPLMIPPELGAQTPLICATQPGLESGGYYHNTHGLVRLPADDPARNAAEAIRLWERCETLASV